jgi:hypothetical protein
VTSSGSSERTCSTDHSGVGSVPNATTASFPEGTACVCLYLPEVRQLVYLEEVADMPGHCQYILQMRFCSVPASAFDSAMHCNLPL